MPPFGMKSVLPAELESKRIKIAKTHNRLVCVLFAGLIVALSLSIPFLDIAYLKKEPIVGVFLGFLVIGAEVYGLYRIIRHDKELCHMLGYLCPICREPLYEARASTWLNGMCPKCHKSVL